MYGLIILCAEKLRYDYGRAAGERHKEAYEQVGYMGGASAYGGQCNRACEFAYDYGIGSIIKLLEQGSRGDGQKINYKLFADTSFGKVIFNVIHFDKPHK